MGLELQVAIRVRGLLTVPRVTTTFIFAIALADVAKVRFGTEDPTALAKARCSIDTTYVQRQADSGSYSTGLSPSSIFIHASV